jgi:glycosyltransferase involved in cell wall biosynthesis
MKPISILTPCYNEEGNVKDLVEEVRSVFRGLPQYSYEHIFIDNASTDRTVAELKAIAVEDGRVKIIVNRRNFGHVRSPHHGLLQTRGDAVIVLVADLQDPPSLLPEFLRKWEDGFKVVLGVKSSSEESRLMFLVRRLYYAVLARLSDVEIVQNATGFGLYDRSFIDELRKLDDPFPYGRGLVGELGFEAARVEYRQSRRKRGTTKNSFLTLYDLAMTGITSHSMWPLRLATISGFTLSVISLLVAAGYLVYKIVYWNRFQAGIAPLVIGLFLSFSLQLFFLGLLGEYVALIHIRVMRRPLVVEKERINFV